MPSILVFRASRSLSLPSRTILTLSHTTPLRTCTIKLSHIETHDIIAISTINILLLRGRHNLPNMIMLIASNPQSPHHRHTTSHKTLSMTTVTTASPLYTSPKYIVSRVTKVMT